MGAASTGIETLTARFIPGRPAVVCYVPLGDPLLGAGAMLDAYADSGIDVLEVGVPARHPWLDGHEVTESMARALDAGTDGAAIGRVLGGWRRARERSGRSVPALLWFAYPEVSLDAVRDAGAARSIDALLMIDPHRHPDADALDPELARLAVARCGFLPWEPTEQAIHTAAGATGYLMVQARPGVTGLGGDMGDTGPLVRRARSTAPGRPVVAGFGISGPDDVRRVLRSGADGVVVGSACIRALRAGGADGLRTLLRAIVGAAREGGAAA